MTPWRLRGPLTCLLLLVGLLATACTQHGITPAGRLSGKYSVREEAVRFASGNVNLAGIGC